MNNLSCRSLLLLNYGRGLGGESRKTLISKAASAEVSLEKQGKTEGQTASSDSVPPDKYSFKATNCKDSNVNHWEVTDHWTQPLGISKDAY